MSILSTLRADGVRLTLKGDQLEVPPSTPPATIDMIRANKTEIIKTLQAEAMFGIEYRNSAIAAMIDHHYCVWHKQCDSEERTQALSLLLEWDDALSLNMKAGALRILSEWKVMEDLVTRVPLAGKTLDKTIRQMFPEQPQRVAVAVTQPKGQPVATAPEPKQETMPFFEPLPPKPKGIIVTIDPAAFGQAVAAAITVTAEAFG